MCAKPVAENFRANMFLGEWQGDPAITSANQVGFLQFNIERALEKEAAEKGDLQGD